MCQFFYKKRSIFSDVRAGGTYADCTLGLAGHAKRIVRQARTRRVISSALIGIRKRWHWPRRGWIGFASELGSEAPQSRAYRRGLQFHRAGTSQPASLDGLLADFGVSSLQFDEARRGFSFQADGPLDMRMDTRSGPTAAQVVNEASERELADLIYEYGEERRSRRIARAIVRGRPVTTTGQLARIVASAAPAMKKAAIHPATTHLSSASHLCKSRAGRNQGAARGRTQVA